MQMATPKHLNNAPITEALIDIKVTPKQGLTFTDLEAVCRSMDFGFYVKGKISHGTVGFMLPNNGEQALANAAMTQVGVRMHSQDEKYVAQFRLDGFTLSRLPPYENWESLIAETKRIWDSYYVGLQPTRVTRIATRFINNLRLPLEPHMSFQLFLRKFADVPEEVPQAMASFFQNFQLSDPANQAVVNLTLALEPNVSFPPLPVILDVDIFTNRDLMPSNPEVWQILNDLREIKNKCFFGSLTDKAMELYE